MEQSTNLWFPPSFSEGDKQTIINQTIDALEKMKNLSRHVTPTLILPDDGFVADSFVENTIILHEIEYSPDVTDKNKFSFQFTGTGDVRFNDPASKLPHTSKTPFKGHAVMESTKKGFIFADLYLTSLHH